MRFISIVYFLLLAYIIAAILFWGHTLDKQSKLMYDYDLKILQEHVDSVENFAEYREKEREIVNKLNARKRQYLGEGVVIVLVILLGAGVVYSTMRSRNKLAKQQNNFILSITHELKSPIAAVKLNLQTLKRPNLNTETQALLVDRSVVEADRLDILTNNLLLASRMEDRHYEPTLERLNLTELVKYTVDMVATRRKEVFDMKLEEECFSLGDSLLWKLVISNLLENAIKYGAPKEGITVVLHQQDEQLLLSVEDKGPGIPDEEKAKIFKKFYRIGNENARKTKGTGLGLYLVSKIVHQFKGSISVSDNKPHGTIFEIAVPVA